MADVRKDYGWTAQDRDPALVLNGRQKFKASEPLLVQDIALPDTALAEAVREYAKRELPEQTFNHSMRVYYYGKETYFHLQWDKSTS